MILISHRGNISGKIESSENNPQYVDLSISKGYDVEVDVWYIDKQLYLGHDNPQYVVDLTWFRNRITKLWIHCKNINAVIFFKDCNYEFNYFWHESDTITLTSLNYIWAYSGKQPIKNSIAVLPEINNENTEFCIGICSDEIENYK
jgi:hypothetical protein